MHPGLSGRAAGQRHPENPDEGGTMPERPNIIYVLADAYRAQAMGFMGADPVVTPNLDAFAEQSVRLSHCVSNRPICSPYRAMLMTGRYPHCSGVPRNCNSDRPDCYLRPESRCWSDVLVEHGYSAGYIGKWHLDTPGEQPHEWLSDRRPRQRQWDAFTPPGPRRHGFGFWYAYGASSDHLHPHYWTGPGGIETRIDVDQWSVEHETDVAIRFLRNDGGRYRQAGRPFVLVVSHNPPHGPHRLVPQKYRAVYRHLPTEKLLNRPNVQLEAGEGPEAPTAAPDYFAMCTGVDENFGRLVGEIDALGLGENTIVIFTADHGEMLGSHARMHKSVWYDESMLVPFLLRAPGRARPRWDDLLLSTPDLCPTLLGLAGLAEHTPAGVQGVDRSAVLCTGQGPRPREALYFQPSAERDPHDARGLRTQRYTYVVRRRPGGTEVMLFDSHTDPYQQTNVADRQPEVVADLHERLLAGLRAIGDPWTARGA
jgi:arylsulfatase A-like enzyme